MVSAPTSSFLVARFGTQGDRDRRAAGRRELAGAALGRDDDLGLSAGRGGARAARSRHGTRDGARDRLDHGLAPAEKAGVGSAVNDTTRRDRRRARCRDPRQHPGRELLGHGRAYRAVVKALDATGAEGAKAAKAVTSSIGGAAQVAQLLGQLEQAGKVPARNDAVPSSTRRTRRSCTRWATP